ncbi:MAG: T9SS type A sorting domain-containing protein, partial [Bacteroidales bacterium]|nr:T9SS type A sorting domain-containing protein [Bacteroidales bacterium]
SPNPSNGIFAINSLLAQPIAVEIVDAAGRLVTSYAAINPGKTVIEAADLSKGVYFIRFTVDGKVLTQKLLIN